MLFTGSSATKHIKYLEGEKVSLLAKEHNNSMITVLDGKETVVDTYDFMGTRERIEEFDEEIMKLKHALNVFNTTTTIKCGLTIDAALVKLAQLNKELAIVSEMKDRPREKVESSYAGQVMKKINYDLEEVSLYHRELVKQIHELQMQIDVVNLTNTFEVEL